LELSGGNRLRIGVAAAAIAGAAILAGCGGSSDSDEPSGTREVRVVKADFPSDQSLGQTSLMRIGVRNESDDAVPGLTVTVSIAGKEGEGSTLPFAVRDPQPGLAQPDRPVWVLAEGYPKLVGSTAPGGAEGAALKTYTFGPLEAGETTDAVWKLSATRGGDYRVRYSIGSTGEVTVETPDGRKPGGTLPADISSEVPDVTVNDKGEVVELAEPKNATK
jgi:multidrug efflux pump subunit AcrA (membrane-fusion protein)